MSTFFNYMLLGNPVRSWLITLGLIAAGLLVIKLLGSAVLARWQRVAKKSVNQLDDVLVTLIDKVGIPLLYILVFYFGVQFLQIGDRVQTILKAGLLVVITWSVLRLITSVIAVMFKRYMQTRTGQDTEKQGRGILMIINIMIWIVGFVFLIDNFGYNITTIITGLGVGGIAIALAAQAILGDLFSYLVIFFDKPFEIGDFIIVDDKMGSIEYIGIKTTRIRTLSGEQLICSNSALTSSWVHNYKRMERRRIVFSFGVVYQTPIEKLKQIPVIVKKIVESQSRTQFDRAHFLKFGDSSLDFEVVYNVLDADYNVYMDKQQAINLSLMERFGTEGIEFAYPTRTLYLNRDTTNALWPEHRVEHSRI